METLSEERASPAARQIKLEKEKGKSFSQLSSLDDQHVHTQWVLNLYLISAGSATWNDL